MNQLMDKKKWGERIYIKSYFNYPRIKKCQLEDDSLNIFLLNNSLGFYTH